MTAASFAEIWRGDFLESAHLGHAVICDGSGGIVDVWGDADKIILPRSSAKMVQALPLITSGAAAAHGLDREYLALACASHSAEARHTDRVAAWLGALGLEDADLRCGTQEPMDREARDALILAGKTPCQLHNNCSGKHAGFLTLNRHLGGSAEYVDPAHPVQLACLDAFEEVTGATSPGFGIDGCSAPNFATSLTGMARAMGWFASAHRRSDRASQAAVELRTAMMAYPELVAGETRSCTQLMRAAKGKAALKTGAEGFFIAILPELELGIALKAEDGATRSAECAIAALLVRLGVLEAEDPAVLKRMNAPILNRAGRVTGYIRPAEALLAGRA